MSRSIIAAALASVGLLIVAAQARDGEPAQTVVRTTQRAPETRDWSAWTRPLAPGVAPAAVAVAAHAHADPPAEVAVTVASDEIDVVDAHWMALTMWGEGRGEGEAGMRAIGHVIHNRWQARRHGAFVTDTVSAAWQFSAWNAGDPNRAAMLGVDALAPGSRDHRLWLTAKHLAAEILAGRSADPTGGALFYHTADVQPVWSKNLPPTAQVGKHLFFASAR